MIAVDTNVLLHAEVVGTQFNANARALLEKLAKGPEPWAIPWPCIYEFLRVATHPRLFQPPVPIDVARSDLAAILNAPTLRLLGATERHWHVLDEVLNRSKATGNLIFDAHIAALCIEHGVGELLTLDGDFARFPGLIAKNPFVVG